MRLIDANKAAAVLLTMLTLLTVGGCGVPWFWANGPAPATTTPAAVAQPATATVTTPPQPTLVPTATATATATPRPTATPVITPQPATVSHGEAEGLVRDFFQALDNKDSAWLERNVAGRALDTH